MFVSGLILFSKISLTCQNNFSRPYFQDILSKPTFISENFLLCEIVISSDRSSYIGLQQIVSIWKLLLKVIIIQISKLFMILLKNYEILELSQHNFWKDAQRYLPKSYWITLPTLPNHVATVPRKRCVIFMLRRCVVVTILNRQNYKI